MANRQEEILETEIPLPETVTYPIGYVNLSSNELNIDSSRMNLLEEIRHGTQYTPLCITFKGIVRHAVVDGVVKMSFNYVCIQGHMPDRWRCKIVN